MRFNLRAFVRTYGGPYDPAPLHEFDSSEPIAIGDVYAIGDILHAPDGSRYVVKTRHFDLDGLRCALLVEKDNTHTEFNPF